MSEISLGDLRVMDLDDEFNDEIVPRPLTPAEFDRIASAQGYVKRPVCGECEGTGHMQAPHPNAVYVCLTCSGCCPSCGGTGFGRLYVGRCSECGGDLIRCVRVWGEGKKCCPDCVHPQALAALDQEDTP